ncbi:MAG: LEA type 2 family protein [Pseudomonadales bacterium]
MRKLLALSFVAWLVAACSSFTLPLQTPSLTLESVQPDTNAGLMPGLLVGLRVDNPNQHALKLRGLEYRIALEGFNVISGVASEIPVIPARGDALVMIDARLGLIEGAQLLSTLLTRPKREIGFSLEAALDTGLPLLGKIPVRQRGLIDLQTYQTRLIDN